MANPERGEVDLEIAGRVYTLKLGWGAVRAIEAAAATPDRRVTFMEVVNGGQKGDFGYTALIVWGAFRKHHPEITLTDVDELLDALGGIPATTRIIKVVNELLMAMAPEARDRGQLKKTDGEDAGTTATTGTRFTSRRGKSA